MLNLIIASAFGRSFSLYEADGTPMDLSMRKVSVLIKKSKEDSDGNAILPRIDFENNPTNEIVPTWSAEQTKNIKEGMYYFGIKIYTIDGMDREIYNSPLRIVKGVFNG